MADLVQAHIAAQARLRAIIARAVAAIWAALAGYDEADVETWLAQVVPVVLAGQRQSIALTDAYIAQELERAPLGLDPAPLIGAAARGGTPPEQQWRRPFIAVWSARSEGVEHADAIARGGQRAAAMGATDIQLSHRAALQAAQDADPAIRGYRRRADGDACRFCRMVNGAFVKRATAAPLHPHCGCGFEVVRDEQPTTALPDGVAVHEHGELGALLADPAHAFSRPPISA